MELLRYSRSAFARLTESDSLDLAGDLEDALAGELRTKVIIPTFQFLLGQLNYLGHPICLRGHEGTHIELCNPSPDDPCVLRGLLITFDHFLEITYGEANAPVDPTIDWQALAGDVAPEEIRLLDERVQVGRREATGRIDGRYAAAVFEALQLGSPEAAALAVRLAMEAEFLLDEAIKAHLREKVEALRSVGHVLETVGPQSRCNLEVADLSNRAAGTTKGLVIAFVGNVMGSYEERPGSTSVNLLDSVSQGATT